jgi:arylsulfatase A-like enzyme
MKAGGHTESAVHGLLLGGVLGLVVGGLEYVALNSAGALSEAAAAYWDIVVSHVIVGTVGGLLVGLIASLGWGGRNAPSHAVQRVWPAVIASAGLAYAVAWATYALGRPVLKPTNVLAYLGAAVGSLLVGVVLHRLLGAILRGLGHRGDRVLRRARLIAPGALAGIIALGLGVPLAIAGRPPRTPADAPGGASAVARPNILVILLDATRPDHLSLYGYSRETDPRIRAFARQGMVFTRMYAQAASTTPSVATLFSSLYPAVHRANDATDFLSRSVPRLPEVLHAAGYRTFGISANANVSPTFGYAQGFDEFRVWKTEKPVRLTLLGHVGEDLLGPAGLARLLNEHSELIPVAQSVTDATLEWAERNRARLVEGKQPFFMYVHYIDPHYPYRPPAPYDRAFDHRTAPPRRRGGTVDPLSLAPPGADRAMIGRTLDQYDGEIRYADHHVGRLLDGLKSGGFLDNTIVIVTADHGEEFFEHGTIGHGRSTYEEVLWVPFVMVWPGKIAPGTTTSQMVGLIDVMPTLLGLLGLPGPPLVQGSSFAALLEQPDRPVPPRTLFAQVAHTGFAVDMARNDYYKFISHPFGPRQGTEEYYDLQTDPLERNNLGSRAPLPATALRKELLVFRDVVARASSLTKPEQARKLDRDTERALRSLGYIK